MEMDAQDVRRHLDLSPHPEGGFYRETFRDEHSTAILFLLGVGDCSHWHRVHGAAETWHFHAGAPLALTLSPDGHDAQAFRLGANLAMGERVQVTVPAGHWQTAESLGAWTLVGCTVAPAFDFANFELAPPDWRPVPRNARSR